MHPSIENHRPELIELCRRYGVRRLEIFGSATRHSTDQDIGDFDFLVEFQDRENGDYADAYFGLLENLEEILNKPVDLVITSAIDNPYFLADIARSRAVVYDA